MAKVILEKIGSPVESFMSSGDYADNLQYVKRLNQDYLSKRDDIRAGWGEKYVEKVHKKNKLTVWERIERLKDPGSSSSGLGGTIANDLLDPLGKLQCTTCHDVHATGKGPRMLRYEYRPGDDTDVVFCRVCHNQ